MWSCGSQNQLVLPRSPPLSPHSSSSQFFLQTESVTWKKNIVRHFKSSLLVLLYFIRISKQSCGFGQRLIRFSSTSTREKYIHIFRKKNCKPAKITATHIFSLSMFIDKNLGYNKNTWNILFFFNLLFIKGSFVGCMWSIESLLVCRTLCTHLKINIYFCCAFDRFPVKSNSYLSGWRSVHGGVR